MPDPRVEAYARLLVEQCVAVKPRWQVLVSASALAQPLVEEVVRQIARRGAYAIVRMSFSGAGGLRDLAWAAEAPDDVLGELAPLDRRLVEEMDAMIAISAPQNTRALAELSGARLALHRQAWRAVSGRLMAHETPWVGCQFPCPALAQEAGMSTREFEEFLYGAVLLDWEAERVRMERIAAHFDGAAEVRIVGAETDLRLSLAGRRARIDAAGANIPGGEFFYSPLEESAEGAIAFTEFPAMHDGREIEGIRLRFEGGRVVEASAEREEAYLLEVLDTDEGARRLGELGIGCNPGITRYMRNTLFDEKMNGTVHLALGNGFPDLGGTNKSAVHWDIVKDLRAGGELYADGELVQRSGEWLLRAS